MERKEAVKKLLELEGKELHGLAEKYNITVIANNGKANKGWAGHVFERYLELPINSAQSPNFGSWELKSIPLNYKKNGELRFKETMAITMIDPINVMQKEFEESHLYAKLQKIVIVARIVGDNFLKPSYVHSVIEFNLQDKKLFEQVKADYNLVRDTLVKNKGDISYLTGKMGVYIQPRTKGAGGDAPKTRAFYARPKFLAEFIDLDNTKQ